MIGTGDHAAAAQDRHAIRCLLDLGELMRDQHHGTAVFGDAPANVQECADLIRQQHRRRLVEQKQPWLADQAFDDLDPLPLADRKIVDLGIRVEREAVVVGEALEPL
jgi:hypothetical protein